jgi:hypothetical protein
VFTRQDKFGFGSLDDAETSRRELPEVILQLKEAYVRTIREAASHEGSWAKVADARSAVEEAIVASQLLNELLG